MTGLGDLIVRVGANISDFKSAMGDVSKEINKTVSDSQRAFGGFDRLGGVLKGVGAQMTAAITLPLVGAGLAATKFATDFELGMRQVTSLVGGATQEDFQTLSDQTLELSRRIGIDAVEATHALYEAISAGIPKENALDFVAVASTAAIAGLTNTGVAVNALTTVIAAYGLKASDAKAVSDAMFQAVNVGKFTFDQLASAIGPAAQQASNLGISYQELLAATATLSITSGGVGVAVTQVESAMRALLDPTKEMKAALKAIGFESGSAATSALGLEGTLQKLRGVAGDSAESFNALFGRIEGASGALGLTGPKAAQAAKDLDTVRHASDGLGASQVALEEINKSTARQFDVVVNSIKSTAIELGNVLIPAVNDVLVASKPLISFLADAVKWFSGLPEPIKTATLGFVALLAAVGPVTYALGQLLSTFATVGKAVTTFSGIATKLAAADLPALTKVVTSLSSVSLPALGAALGIAGAAFAGWKIGEWIANMQKAQTGADNLKLGIERMGTTMKQGSLTADQYAKALENAGRHINESAMGSNAAEQNLRRMEGTAKQLGISVDRAGLSVSEYTKKLQDAINKTLNFAGSVAKASDELAGHSLTTAADAAAESVVGLHDVLVTTTPALEGLANGTQHASEDLGDVAQSADDAKNSVETFNSHVEHTADTAPQKLGRMAQQVSTIFSDMGKNFAAGIFKLFDNSENKKLDTQIVELRGQLAAATEEYAHHVEEVSAKLAAIPVAYSDAIAELDGITASKLSGIDESYAKSIEGLQSRFEDITKAAAAQLDKQLKDLDEQLKDKKKDYERDTQDANKSYKRDTANLKESLDDKEREYRQWVEDQQLKLRQLEGDNSDSAKRQREAIQQELRHRAEDMEDTRADIAEALRREEEDLAESLKRRQEDWDADQQKIKDKQDEARTTYQATLKDAQEDLKKSLADRQAEYDKDRAAAIAAYESAKTEIVKKYADQTAALKEELAKQAAEYDKYKLEVDGKLKTLEDAHKGPLQRIGDMFKDVFKSAGEAVLRFAGEEVMGVLFKHLDDLLSKIPGIGSALGGIFGGASGAAGTAASGAGGAVGTAGSVGGGAGSGAASAGVSSTASWVTAISSAVSAVTDVLSMFGVGVQGTMKETLNGIHNDTTYLAKAFGDMGLKDSLMGGMNDIKAFVSAQGGWVHDAWVELLGRVENLDALKWYADDTHRRIGDIKDYVYDSMRSLQALNAAAKGPPLTINVTGYVGDREALIAEIKRQFGSALALQGA